MGGRRADGFADQGIMSEVWRGVSDDSVCERGTLLCAPHIGALQALEIAEAKLLGWGPSGLVFSCHRPPMLAAPTDPPRTPWSTSRCERGNRSFGSAHYGSFVAPCRVA